MYNNLIYVLLLAIIWKARYGSKMEVSADCEINTKVLGRDTQPLILLASTRQWYPLTYSHTGAIIVPEAVSILLVCPNLGTTSNWFEKFYKKNEILAKCIEGEKFIVEDMQYAFQDLQCLYFFEPSLRVTEQPCLAPNPSNKTSLESNWIQVLVGYPTLYDFVPVYTICFDEEELGALYSVSTIYPEIKRNEFPVNDSYWMSDDDLYGDIRIDAQYTCSKQADTFRTILGDTFKNTSSCCFSKFKLVPEDDLIYRPQQIATYHYVNTVPQCHKENSLEVNKRLRILCSDLGRPLTVWTGVAERIVRAPDVSERHLYLYYNSEHDKAMPVPLFLWKIIIDGHTNKAIALVTINDPERAHLSLHELIRCKDVCEDLLWIYFEDMRIIDKGYTYCCEVGSFLEAFGYTKNHFPKTEDDELSLNALLKADS